MRKQFPLTILCNLLLASGVSNFPKVTKIAKKSFIVAFKEKNRQETDSI